MAAAAGQDRWRRQAVGATLLRAAVLAGPVLASLGAAVSVRPLLPAAASLAGRAGNLLVLLLVSTAVLVLVDRLARRALPLVTLLNLSMLFPDRAPSRLRVAREAIRRRPIEEQLARVRDAGADPSAVAQEILTLVAALSRHDRPTRGHAERVRMFTDLLAAQLKVPERDRDLLRWAAILHDIGKLRVPATLLNKPGKPTDEEWSLLKAHPGHGAEMAAALLPWLGEWGTVILEHHERYDGTGYPTGLSGAQISLGARIVSVADAYDVMTAARAYKRPVSRAAALAELVRFSGSQFDPTVVRAMVAVGAPRLRRAQGLVSWLADVPLVAGGAVPAATVARVVGAGALATGAVTGGLPAAVDGLTTPPRTATVAQAAADQRATSATGDLSQQDGRSATPAADRLPDASPTTTSSARPTRPRTTAPATTAPSPLPDEPSTLAAGDSTAGPPGGSDDGSASSASAGPSTPATTSPSPKAVPSPTSTATGTEPATGSVGQVVDDTVDTVGGVADGVTSTVDDVVDDPVGTVDGVLQDPLGTVGGVLGGTSSSSPSPTPSPTATRGGLLGGILGR
jgi:hypothetical protein